MAVIFITRRAAVSELQSLHEKIWHWPRHAIAMTRCAFREGSLISLEGPTLLQCSVAQEIQKDARMGNLKLLVLNRYVFRGFYASHNWRIILWKPAATRPISIYSHVFVGFLSTLYFELDWAHRAFSIRVAVSLPNGRIDTAIARGWEDISERIAEIETQDLATRSFVWVKVIVQWLSMAEDLLDL